MKFRVWDGEKMHYPAEHDCCESGSWFVSMDGTLCFIQHDYDGCHIDPDISDIELVSTGQKDKNGKDIYLDDVISYADLIDGHSHTGLVKFHQGCFFASIDQYQVRLGEWAEIIGNIHENPELA